jgi:hypothetical protein
MFSPRQLLKKENKPNTADAEDKPGQKSVTIFLLMEQNSHTTKAHVLKNKPETTRQFLLGETSSGAILALEIEK